MKRYKLLKDLPMFDAGEEGFYLDSDGNLMHHALSSGETVYPAPTLARHPEILRDWFEEISEQPKTVWDLKDGDAFWVIEENDVIRMRYWDGFEYHRSLREYGNGFLTIEDAEKELARRKAKVILERDTKGFKPDWSRTKAVENMWVYTAYYDHEAKQLRTNGYATRQFPCSIWFATDGDAEASIKTHGKEWLCYLGVEE